MNINPQTLKDLVGVYGRIYVPQAAPELLQDLREILPMIERADTPDGERACVAALLRKPGPKPFEPEIRDAIRELCNYRPELRGQLLDAAVTGAKLKAGDASALATMVEDVRTALANLGPREKALLRIIEELEAAGGEINVDFANLWRPIAREASAEVLRSDPSMGALMKAFDAAVLVNEEE